MVEKEPVDYVVYLYPEGRQFIGVASCGKTGASRGFCSESVTFSKPVKITRQAVVVYDSLNACNNDSLPNDGLFLCASEETIQVHRDFQHRFRSRRGESH